MVNCSYCGSELEVKNKQADCNFCDITLGPGSEFGMYIENGVRKDVYRKAVISSDHAKLPLAQLKCLHILDLVLCLKAARKERAEIFSQVRLFNKAEGSEYKEWADESGSQYEYWTRKCWTIENLLIQRIGYFPERINQEYLASLVMKNEKSLAKPLVISKQKV